MENIKSIISKNLIKLRKQNKITQVELAEKLSYSDKAISRWENGEVTPDVETLNKIAGVYNVSLTSLFEENLNIEEAEKLTKKQRGNQAAIILLSISFVWLLATVLYVCADLILNKSVWEIFVYAVPATFLIAFIFSTFWGTRIWKYIFISALVWSALLSIYLSLIKYNVWIIFILGAPIQVVLLLWGTVRRRR